MKTRLASLCALAALLQGGCTVQLWNSPPAVQSAKAAGPVDFADPVLSRRKILLFGDIDERAAERTIQKLLFLEGKSQEPIDLYLMTPGGEFKYFFAIEHVMRSLKSPSIPARFPSAIRAEQSCWPRARANERRFAGRWWWCMA